MNSQRKDIADDTLKNKEKPTLPYVEGFEFKIPNNLLLLDQDIKKIWNEEVIIKQKITLLKEDCQTSMKRSIIFDVYEKFLDSDAGKIYRDAKISDKLKQINVCFSCYQFYTVLKNQIYDIKGNINMPEVHKMSDPLYKQVKESNKESISFAQTLHIIA
jgi:hypothetical protein